MSGDIQLTLIGGLGRHSCQLILNGVKHYAQIAKHLEPREAASWSGLNTFRFRVEIAVKVEARVSGSVACLDPMVGNESYHNIRE